MLVETEALTKRYPHVTALEALNLSLEPGVIGLVGANGAGKSTLLKIMLGLVEPTSGRASVLGLDVQKQGPELRQYVGYLPEHDCLPGDISATEFVAHMAQISGLPRNAARERTAETLRHVGLFEERYREIRGYSQGMKQRVKLAQALVHDPKLMLLDEPTVGLDPQGRDEMLELVRRTGKEFGIAIIMSSHLLGEIEQVCDHLVVIDAGHLVRSASIASFTEHTGVLAIEVEGSAERLAEALAAKGLDVRHEERTVLVRLNGVQPYDVIRDTIVDLGMGLVRMEQRRHAIEDVFRPGTTATEASGVERE